MSDTKTICTQQDRVLVQNLDMFDELSNTEMKSISGGMTTLTAYASSRGQAATEEIEFEGVTIFASGGHYDHDEGVCYPD